jgi:hypothetical protein
MYLGDTQAKVNAPTMHLTLRKLCRHSRIGLEYELPRQYLSKESQPLYMGRKDVLVTNN